MKKKTTILFLLTVALTAVAFVGCEKGGESSTDSSEASVEQVFKEISLNETKIELAMGETATLTASNAVGDIVWISNDSTVATVDEKGVVTPIGVGTTIIKARDSLSVAMCQITVVGARTENLVTIQMNKTALSIFEGDTYKLSATLKNGSEIVQGAITFESLDEKTATVSQDGLVTAIAEGQTEIVIKASYAEKTAQASVTVNVSKIQPVLAFGVNESQAICGEELPLCVYLMEGKTLTELDNTQVIYTLSDASLANIENGKLYPLKKGDVTILATYTLNGEELQAQIPLRLRERYTVNYFVDGNLWHETTVLDGESIANDAPIPTHDMYTFCAWETTEDSEAIFSNKVAYDFSATVEKDLILQAEWYSAEQKLFAFDQGVAGATKNWQMNAAGTGIEYTTEKAYGEEAGSLKITSLFLEEYSASPAEVYLGSLDLAKCKMAWFYIYNTQPNYYYFDCNWGNRVFLSADNTWKKVEIMPMANGKVLVTINGTEGIYDDLHDLSQDGFSIHPAHLDTRNERCDTYVSAVYAIKELDNGMPMMQDANGNVYAASNSDVYTGGLKYTVTQGYGESVLYLPTINFANYTQISFDWRISGWTFIGPEAALRYYKQGDALGGKVTIVKNADGTLTLTMTQTLHEGETTVFTRTIDDVGVLNGVKPVTLSVHCLVTTQWVDIGNFVKN